MKTKILFILLSTFSLLLSTCLAQDVQLGNISFCNNGETTNELDLIAKAGEEVPICVNFENIISKDITINVDFLDAIITQDKLGNRACSTADKPKKSFGNFMKEYNTTLTISGNSTIQKIYTIKLPIGFQGISHGCIAYNIIQTGGKTTPAMVNVIIRKVKFIDILVGEAQVKSQIMIGSIKKIKTGKTINFQIGLKNIGNTDQSVTVSGTITNIFGFRQPLIFDRNILDIQPNQEIQIQTNNSDLSLPFYGGFFTIRFQIHNQPNFNFNITNTNAPKTVALGGNFKLSKMIFIPNLYVMGIILLLIYMLFFRKKRKHLVVQTKENPIDPPVIQPVSSPINQ